MEIVSNYLGIFILVFFYFIYMKIKTLRDYINIRSQGYPARWKRSVYTEKYSKWFQGYLLDEPMMFIENNPPQLIKLLVWNNRSQKFRNGAIDGWHQLDGLIFMIPYWMILSIMFLYGMIQFNWYLAIYMYIGFPFFPIYWFFNLNFHVLKQKSPFKEWNRVWPFSWFSKR